MLSKEELKSLQIKRISEYKDDLLRKIDSTMHEAIDKFASYCKVTFNGNILGIEEFIEKKLNTFNIFIASDSTGTHPKYKTLIIYFD